MKSRLEDELCGTAIVRPEGGEPNPIPKCTLGDAWLKVA
jgi:hypothetical protein